MKGKIYDPSARASQLGYKYQDLYALFLLLSQIDIENYITYESKDDIVFYNSQKESLFQIKYKIPNHLTDRSHDFWSTLRNWCSKIKNNELNISKSEFILVTTEKIQENSLIYKINYKKENKDEIINQLLEITNEKDNKKNEKSYHEVKYLIDNEKDKFKKLIDKIEIHEDNYLTYDKLVKKVKNCLNSTKPDLLYDRIFGWWNNEIVLCLKQKKEDNRKIYFKDLKDKIISENKNIEFYDFPIYPEDRHDLDLKIEDYINYKFVKQLKIIDYDEEIKPAIKDFYRARKKINQWINTLSSKDLEQLNDFDSKLIEYWKRGFERMKDKNINENNDYKKQEAKNFYRKKYVESTPDIKIGNTKEDFLNIGNSHRLANKLEIGWHPDFKEILKDTDNIKNE
jgi:hypothetical protein